MDILEYEDKYKTDVMNLFLELQEYIVSLDIYGFNIVSENYKEKYFEKTMVDISKSNGKMYLAIEDDRPQGLIVCTISPSETTYDYVSSDVGHIVDLIVSKKSQSKGVGKLLLNRAEDYLKKSGCTHISLDVFGYNTKAIEFYKKLGYHDRLITMSKKI